MGTSVRSGNERIVRRQEAGRQMGDTDRLPFSLDFELNTGRGGNRIFLEPEPEPSAGNVSLTCEGMDDDFTAAWNPDTAKWDKPLPAKQQGK
ncbi:hypothetical protein [Trueperella pyogenes]